MEVLNLTEADDGSATIEVELTEFEQRTLIQMGFDQLMRNMIKLDEESRNEEAI